MTITMSTSFTSPTGLTLLCRPLQPHDAAALGRYFEGLSAETRRRFGPHPLDLATAAHLCATLNPAEYLRFVAFHQAEIVAYFILQLGITPHEAARYAARNLPLDPNTTATLAPSVADAYQGQGIGSPILRHVLAVAREVGRKQVVLLGGVQVTNSRAVHFYHKHGFQAVGQFEYPAECWNEDMRLEFVKL